MSPGQGKRTEGKEAYPAKRIPYASPTLTTHGDVEEITQILRLAVVNRNVGTIVPDVG